MALIRLLDNRFGPDKTTSCSCNGLHCLIHMFQKTEILRFTENNPNLTSELPHSITLLASRGNGTSVPTRHVSLQSIDTISRYLRNEFIFWNVHGIMNTSGLVQSK